MESELGEAGRAAAPQKTPTQMWEEGKEGWAEAC